MWSADVNVLYLTLLSIKKQICISKTFWQTNENIEDFSMWIRYAFFLTFTTAHVADKVQPFISSKG